MSISTNKRIIATADFILRLVWYISIAGTAFYIVFMLAGPIFGFIDNTLGLKTPVKFSILEQGVATFNSDQIVPVNIKHAKGIIRIEKPVPQALVVPFFIMTLGMAGLILWVFYSLRKIIQSVKEGNPFSVHNGRRLRVIAFSMIGIEVIGAFADLIKMLYLVPKLSFETVKIHSIIHISPHVIIAGLVILVIAEAFRIGAEMKDEQELTI